MPGLLPAKTDPTDNAPALWKRTSWEERSLLHGPQLSPASGHSTRRPASTLTLLHQHRRLKRDAPPSRNIFLAQGTMPRPKLLPSQRQRAAEACNLCREAKRRCSGTTPCTHCLRRGMASSCTMTCRPRGSRGAATTASGGGEGSDSGSVSGQAGRSTQGAMSGSSFMETDNRRQSSASMPAGGAMDTSGDSGSRELFRPISPSESRAEHGSTPTDTSQNPNALSNSDLATMSPHPRMLLNRRGERGKSICCRRRSLTRPLDSPSHSLRRRRRINLISSPHTRGRRRPDRPLAVLSQRRQRNHDGGRVETGARDGEPPDHHGGPDAGSRKESALCAVILCRRKSARTQSRRL